MAVTPEINNPPSEDQGSSVASKLRKPALKLLWRLLLYHAFLAVSVIIIAELFPAFLEELPIGGVRLLKESGDVTVGTIEQSQKGAGTDEFVGSIMDVTDKLDRLGYARKLIIVLFGVWLLMLPVSWVIREMNRGDMHDRSLDETTLILPGVVASIVLVVQHSLALAFSLAGIIAGVQFRRALQDTYDALFILVAIGVGIAAGIGALEIAAVLSVFFTYATLYICLYGEGLETHHVRRQKLEKKLRKAMNAAAAESSEQENSSSS